MEIQGIRVWLAGKEVAPVEHVGAVGMQVGGAGELVVMGVIEESDENLQKQKFGFPQFVYAPGTWLLATTLEPKASPKVRVPKIEVPTRIH